jgi:hypothetical protein
MFMASLPMWGQDYIYTKSGLEIKAKVKEVRVAEVVYTYYEQTNIVRHIALEDVEVIKYEDGTSDYYGGAKAGNNSYSGERMSIGIGGGASTPPLGIKFGFPLFGSERTFIHLGLGFTESDFGLNVGIKNYVYKNTGYFDIGLIFFDKSKLIPITVGGDWVLAGRPNELQFGFNFGIGGMLELDRGFDKILPAGDLGFFFRF